jgi:RNA polymerase sigma-54 factor
MALEQRLSLKQTLQLRMTPQLRLAIRILQVSRAELESIVSDELCQNPTLEEQEEVSDPHAAETGVSRTGDVESTETESGETPAAEREQKEEIASLSEVDWQELLERNPGDFHGSIGTGSDRDDNRASFLENTASQGEDLVSAILDQLNLVMMSDEERRVGTIIAHNLDRNGYLSCTPEEIAFMANTTVEFVNEVREIIQDFEPRGVASIDLRECLLCQLRSLGYEDDDYVIQIVDSHLPELESRRYEKLAKMIGTTADEVLECHRIIQSLEPKPGRNFDEGDTRYVVPDVYIVKVGNDFQVLLNDEGLPHLRVSSYYRDMARRSEDGKDTKSYVQEKIRAATWLIRSIEQRQRTLRKVTESIVRFQKPFLMGGVEHLRPMVLKDVANDIGMHESTVSRATANKYVHTAQGIFELKYFFTSSIRGTDGIDVSSESVKQRIQQIISAEDPKQPHSDQWISQALAKENIDIARRTVAKYRELLGILPSSKRKRFVAGG